MNTLPVPYCTSRHAVALSICMSVFLFRIFSYLLCCCFFLSFTLTSGPTVCTHDPAHGCPVCLPEAEVLILSFLDSCDFTGLFGARVAAFCKFVCLFVFFPWIFVCGVLLCSPSFLSLLSLQSIYLFIGQPNLLICLMSCFCPFFLSFN